MRLAGAVCRRFHAKLRLLGGRGRGRAVAGGKVGWPGLAGWQRLRNDIRCSRQNRNWTMRMPVDPVCELQLWVIYTAGPADAAQ